MLGMIYISAPILLIINLNKNYDEKDFCRLIAICIAICHVSGQTALEGNKFSDNWSIGINVGGVVHHHQINVGCGVVQRVACNTPQGNAVDAVVLIVLIIELVRQTSGFCHFILSFVHTGTFSVFSMGLTAATAYQPVRNFMSIL